MVSNVRLSVSGSGQQISLVQVDLFFCIPGIFCCARFLPRNVARLLNVCLIISGYSVHCAALHTLIWPLLPPTNSFHLSYARSNRHPSIQLAIHLSTSHTIIPQLIIPLHWQCGTCSISEICQSRGE